MKPSGQLVDAGELDLDAPLSGFAGPVNPVQKAIETITKQPFETTLTQLVFEPLDMSSSSLAWRPQFEANFASSHENGKPIAKQRLAAANASGSLQTTATDYGRFLLAALTGERLSDSIFRQWLEPVFHVPWATTGHLNFDPIKPDDDVAWGLGWGIAINRKSFFQWGWLSPSSAAIIVPTVRCLSSRPGCVRLQRSCVRSTAEERAI